MCSCLQASYAMPLDVYYEQVFKTAEECNAAMVSPWELVPFHTALGRVHRTHTEVLDARFLTVKYREWCMLQQCLTDLICNNLCITASRSLSCVPLALIHERHYALALFCEWVDFLGMEVQQMYTKEMTKEIKRLRSGDVVFMMGSYQQYKLLRVGNYDFGYDAAAFGPIADAIWYQRNKVRVWLVLCTMLRESLSSVFIPIVDVTFLFPSPPNTQLYFCAKSSIYALTPTLGHWSYMLPCVHLPIATKEHIRCRPYSATLLVAVPHCKPHAHASTFLRVLSTHARNRYASLASSAYKANVL